MDTDSDEDEFFDAHEELTFQRFNSFRSSFLTYRNFASSAQKQNTSNGDSTGGVAGNNNEKVEDKPPPAQRHNDTTATDNINTDFINGDTIELINIFNIYNVYNIYYNAEECVTVKTPVNTGTSSPLPVAPPRTKKSSTRRVTKLKEIEYVKENGDCSAVRRKPPLKLLPPPPPNHCRIKAQCIDILDGIHQTTSECESGTSSRVGRRSLSINRQNRESPESDTSIDRTPVNKRRNRFSLKEHSTLRDDFTGHVDYSDSSNDKWSSSHKDNCFSSDDDVQRRIDHRHRRTFNNNEGNRSLPKQPDDYSKTIAYSDDRSLNFTDVLDSSCVESCDERTRDEYFPQNPLNNKLASSMVDIDERTLADFSVQEYSPRLVYKGDQSSAVVSEKEDCSSNVVSNDENSPQVVYEKQRQNRNNKRSIPLYSRKVYSARVIDEDAESTDASYVNECSSSVVSNDESSARSHRSKIRRSGQVNKRRRVHGSYSNERYTPRSHNNNDDEYSIVSDDGNCSSSTVSNDEYPSKMMRKIRHSGLINNDRRKLILKGFEKNTTCDFHDDDDQSSVVSTIDECSSSVFSNDDEVVKISGYKSRLPSIADDDNMTFETKPMYSPRMYNDDDDQSSVISTADDECPLNVIPPITKHVAKIRNITRAKGIVNIDQRLLDLYSNEKNSQMTRINDELSSGIESIDEFHTSLKTKEKQVPKIGPKKITSEIIEAGSCSLADYSVGEFAAAFVYNNDSCVEGIISHDENEHPEECLNGTPYTDVKMDSKYFTKDIPKYTVITTTTDDEEHSSITSHSDKMPSDDTSGIVNDKTPSMSESNDVDKQCNGIYSSDNYSPRINTNNSSRDSQSPITSILEDSSSNVASNDEEDIICDKIRSLRVGCIDKRYAGLYDDKSSIVSNHDECSLGIVSSEENSLKEAVKVTGTHTSRIFNRNEGPLCIPDERPSSPKVVDIYRSSPDLSSDDDNYSWRFTKNNKTTSIRIQKDDDYKEVDSKVQSTVYDKVEKSYTPELKYEKSYTPELKHEKIYTPELKYEKSYTPELKYEKSYTPELKYEKSYTPELKYEKIYTPELKYEKSYTPKLKYEESYTSKPPKLKYEEERFNTNLRSDESSTNNDTSDDYRCSGIRTSAVVHKEYDEIRDELEYSMEMDTQKYLEEREEEENPPYLNDVNSDEGRQLLSEKLSKLSETLTRIMSPPMTPTAITRQYSVEQLPETPAENSPRTPTNPENIAALMSSSTLSSRQSMRRNIQSEYPSNRICDHLMSGEDLSDTAGNLIHLYSTVDGQLQYERTIELKVDDNNNSLPSSDRQNNLSSSDIQHRNETIPLNSITAKDLTDEEILERVITSDNMLNEEEILEQVFIKDLDTGEMIPLSVAEEKLSQPDNTLRLHIMRIDTIKPNTRKKKTLKIDPLDEDNSVPFTVTKLQEKRKKIKRFFDKTIRKIKSSARRGSFEHCKVTDSPIIDEERDENFSIFDKNDHNNTSIYDRDKDFKTKFDSFQQKQNEGYLATEPRGDEIKKDNSVMLDHIRLLKDLCGGHIGAIWTMNFVLYGKLLANAGKENIVRVWVMKDAALNLSDMRQQYTYGRPLGGSLPAITMNDDVNIDFMDGKGEILI